MAKKNTIPRGTLFKTNCGDYLEVIEYNSAKSIIVQFTDGLTEPFSAHIGNLRKGKYQNPFKPTVQGKGYLGVGNYCTTKHKFAAMCWRGMLCRVYSEFEKAQRPSTVDLQLHEDWHNFQIFAEWATNQKGYGIEGFEIDKDLLIRNNNLYSPTTCCFLPRKLNTRLPKRYSQSSRVYYYPKDATFRAYVTDTLGNRKVFTGYSENIVRLERELFLNNVFKTMALEYKENLSDEAFSRLSDYFKINEAYNETSN